MSTTTATTISPNAAAAVPKARSRRSRVRANSDEIPRLVQGQMDPSSIYYADQMHAAGMGISSPSPSPRSYQQPPGYYPSYGSYTKSESWGTAGTASSSGGPMPPPTIPRPHHARTHSWSGPPPVMLPPGFPPSSPRTRSTDLVDESQPLLQQQQQNHQHQSQYPERRRSSRRKGSGHRKSYSTSAATPGMYGAFFDQPGTPTQSERSLQNMAKFSPRNDLMSLTSSFRGGHSGSPLTVQTGEGARGESPVYGVAATSPLHNSWSPTRTMSPRSLPATPLQTGEAVFLAQSTRRVRPESNRKMHRRQQSAQLFVEEVKGQEQSHACRDVVFLLVFVFHLLFVGYLGNLYGSEALKMHTVPVTSLTNMTSALSTATLTGEKDEVIIYYKNFFYIACLSGPFAVALSAMLLSAMTLFARHFVKVALIIAITLSFVWGTVGIGLSPKTIVPITGIIALALTVAYTFIVWDRIPFAAANLLTALSGVHANPGTIVVAFCFQALALGWSIYYAVVVCGVYNALQNGSLKATKDFQVAIYFLLSISYYWTFQVLQNAVQVTTAAVIGGWWHSPDEKGIVRKACFKTFFYYMGSICYGSLLVGPVRLLRQLSGFFRPTSAENASLMCLHECMNCIQTCISSCVDAISTRFNSWGLTYVGLYGYGFMDASQHASELFEKRGWTVIVSDDLVPNILLMTSLVIGGVTGCFAHLIAQIDGFKITSMETNGLASFAEGTVIGVVLTSVLFAVISSSVNTVIVCFAASPVDFEENHNELSHEMRSAWREVWPGALDVMDVRLGVPGIPIPPPVPQSPLV